MSSTTGISWTDATWNPVTGCTKISPGCKNCYAEALTRRWGRDFNEVKLHPERLEQPLHWRKPRRIFVNSMSDLFHEAAPDDFVTKVWCTMRDTPRHVYQILTKRPERMLAYVLSQRGYSQVPGQARQFYGYVPLSNVWLGVSVENQAMADERIPLLLLTPAAVRFVSVEPILDAMDVARACAPLYRKGLACAAYSGCSPGDVIPCQDLHWIIVGGESGAHRRKCDPAWIISIVEQCKAAGVPCWVKQAGALKPGQQGDLPDEIWNVKESP